jgi:hypothetical protein
MIQTTNMRGAFQLRWKRTGRVSVAAFLLALHAFALPVCAAYFLGLDHALGFDLSKMQTDPPGLAFFTRPPILPWVLGPLALLSLAAVWFCSELRQFWFVMAVALAWLAFMVVAVASGVDLAAILEALLIVALLVSGRSAFSR